MTGLEQTHERLFGRGFEMPPISNPPHLAVPSDRECTQVLTTVTAARDRRPITPEELQVDSEIGGLVSAKTDPEIATFADEVAQEIAVRLNGRELWRQIYTLELPRWDDRQLALPRWPVEDDPPAVYHRAGLLDSTDFRIAGECRSALIRRTNHLEGEPVAAVSAMDYEVRTFTAGYVMPGQVGRYAAPDHILTWEADTVYDLGRSHAYGDATGSFVYATSNTIPVIFELTVAAGAKTSDSSEPSWNTTPGATTADNDLTWTARRVGILPQRIRRAARLVARKVWGQSAGGACSDESCEQIEKLLSLDGGCY